MHLTKILLILLFFILPLVHGNLLPTLGIPFSLSVSGNFEFTKVMFFNILSGLIFLSFFFATSYPWKGKEFKLEFLSWTELKIWLSLLLILFLSTIFSTSPFISLIGDTEKWHTAIMYLNLLGLFFILKKLDKTFLQKLIVTSLFAGVWICIIALKEYFFQTFEYGDLSNRALGSFWHPNYLAWYLLLLLPFIYIPFIFSRKKIYERGVSSAIWIIFLFTLFLTKSIVALFLVIGYIIYTLQIGLSPRRGKFNRGVWLIGILWFFCLLLSIIFFVQYFPEKLHSFLSRFYLWETTLKIIFSDIKIFFFGAGAETLPYFFDSYKVPEVYIYENFWYTADRAHNFFLDIFFQFGIFWVLFFSYSVFIFFKDYKKIPSLAKISLFLFLLFGIFHYFSIASYVLVVLILSLSWSRTSTVVSFPLYEMKGARYGIYLFFSIVSLSWTYFSLQLYRAELTFASWNTQKAQEIFIHPKYLIELGKYMDAEKREWLLSQNNLKEQIITKTERQKNCDTLTWFFPSAENLFYCGDIFWNLGKEDMAKNYYRQGLAKLPDLWYEDSLYWKHYFIKQSITWNRFFSEKFSNINIILTRLDIKRK